MNIRAHTYSLLAFALSAVFLLTGCARERVRIVTRDVPVPVLTGCITPSQVPPVPKPLPPIPLDANAALSLSLAKNFELFGYAWTADALLQECAGIAPLNIPALWTTPAVPPAPQGVVLEPIEGGYLLRTGRSPAL